MSANAGAASTATVLPRVEQQRHYGIDCGDAIEFAAGTWLPGGEHRHYGIDCGDAIEFAAGTWLPGGEHVKRISVKNVSQRTLKFKYELPTTKYFSMDFPTLITLSPGMQTALDVAFRPVKLEEYDDFVTFHVQIIDGGVVASQGRFRLPVLARIARLAIEVPRGLDFGFCPTAETTDQTFVVRNTGQIDAVFDWRVPGAGVHGRPFAVRPATGRVNVGQAVELTASFAPTCASVYVATTVCSARPVSDDGYDPSTCYEQEMKISGISKFTHIAASENELNFGDLFVATATPPSGASVNEKEFVLRNRSLVRASFQICRVENDCDPVFFFSPTHGIVPPESVLSIRVRYTPLSAGTFTCDHFDIVTPGGNRERITCKGRAIGPTVSLWRKNLDANRLVPTRAISFGDVALGQSTTRVLTMRNESPVEVSYHVDCQARGGVFEFDKVNGRIAAAAEVNVILSFAPTRVGNFYRRVFVLLQNQSPLAVDLLATGYDEKTRPSPFQLAHVDAYRLRSRAGIGLLSPDQLETYWQDHGDDLFLQGALRRAKALSSDLDQQQQQQLLTRSGEATFAAVETCHEYFINVNERANPILVANGEVLDFGNCSIVQFPSKKLLHVTNNTHGKVTCTWRVASASDDGTSFQVHPEAMDISAGATAEFRVAFQPARENAYYFAELEGFVAFKSNRTFRLVNVETFTPPWCVVVKVGGNTFASPTEQFLSKLSFRLPSSTAGARVKRVHFPPCYLGDQVFQTILLDNASDTPAVFAFREDPSEVFSCKPRHGYIPAKSFHLVQLRFSPRAARKHTHMLQCAINNARGSPELLELVGICATAQLRCETDGLSATEEPGSAEPRLFIKPTAIGLQSSRRLRVTNTSRVPLVYRWDVPRKLRDVFAVSPQLGRLNGRESVTIDCNFTPTEERDYMARFTLSTKPISLSWSQWQQTQCPTNQASPAIAVLHETTVRVQTKGTCGAVLFEPDSMRLETILVNTSSKTSFAIVNTADCDLDFTLSQSVRGDTFTSDQVDAPTGATLEDARLVFSQDGGRIPARSRKTIAVTFMPRVAGEFEFAVGCSTWTGGTGASSPLPPVARRQQCIVRAEASFPTVVIEDLRMPKTPTPVAWHQFLCHEINAYLSAPLAKEEARHGSAQDGESHEAATVKHFAIPFSPAPVGTASEQVFFKLTNPGSLLVEFSLRYPKEGSVEVEHWAETGTPSSEEVRLNAIIDSQVFGISPRRGTLRPRQSVTLVLSYAYSSEAYGGIHDLPIILQVENGKRLMLELQGRTLPRGEPKLFLPRRVIHLSPVMIGEFRREMAFTLARRRHAGGKENTCNEAAPTPEPRPPVQQIEVFNCGDSAFRLEVSAHAFAKVNKDNFGFPVLVCRSESDIVAPRSSTWIDIEFSPVEAKTIEANLIVKAHGLMGRPYKEVAMLTLVATGYHPVETPFRELRDGLARRGPAPQPRFEMPGQCVRLETDALDLGHVPTFAVVTRVLVLRNVSAVARAGFDWDAAHPLVARGLLQFSPARGELAPGEERLVRVTLSTTGEVLVLDHDVACRVTVLEAATGTAASPVKVSALRAVSQTHASVISRSTATQPAAMSPRAGRGSRSGAPAGATGAPAPLGGAVFLHVFAHVLPRALMERFYPRDALEKMPPTALALRRDSAARPMSTADKEPLSTDAVVGRYRVVLSVMESLVLDALHSEAVESALDAELSAERRNVETAIEDRRGQRDARLSDDCEAIAANVMENTVFNVLQELFVGDIEAELMCVPRKAVFPESAALRV
ncbi:hypothetical protein P43SY_001392 [Pythium insidiosum]|uniref:Abnormal spindle-like microcephaly-associated protein ASH domain-containing protein n=1 Tax=Pythium insidiosum TaxID=114742 RepID=A0AAD5Q7X2_PYTIN|nr:hypothetical protein P43SY_001392 [Pythium insidiosum]